MEGNRWKARRKQASSPISTPFCRFLTNLRIIGLETLSERFILYKVRVATMTHFCTFGTATPVLIIGFSWFFFFLIDRFKSQAVLVQVSSTLLNSDSRTRVKCENIFVCHCGKSRAKIFPQKDCALLVETQLLWFSFNLCSLWPSIGTNTLF